MSPNSETRDRLLRAGIAMLHERGVIAGVDHVRLSAVCARAGYTTGAAYRCWPSQADFHRDLAAAAIRWRDRTPWTDTLASIRHLLQAGAPLLEVLRVGAEANVQRTVDSSDFYITLALRACALHDPALMPASVARVTEGLAAHEELFAALLTHFGRRMRHPFTIDQLVATVAALAEGFAVQDCTRTRHPRLTRDDLGDGVGDEWTLFGTVLQFVVDAFTEPEPEPDPASGEPPDAPAAV